MKKIKKIPIIDKVGEVVGHYKLLIFKDEYGDWKVAEDVSEDKEYDEGCYQNEVLYINLKKRDDIPSEIYLDYAEE